MPYISEHMSTEEALRLHGAELPDHWRERIECESEAAADAADLQETVWALEERLQDVHNCLVENNWRTGKKAELKEILEAIDELFKPEEKVQP